MSRRWILACAFCVLLLAGCQTGQVEPQEQAEPLAAIYSPPPTEPEPVRELLEDIREIVVAGRFMGEMEREFDPGPPQRYTTYENPLLRLRYHFDENEDSEFAHWFRGVSQSEYPDGLFEALGFGTSMVVRLIEGDGREWVELRVRADEERFIEIHRDWLQYLAQTQGREPEEVLYDMRDIRQGMDEWYEMHGQRIFDTPNYDELAFWPVEHLVAGLYYRGYQIHVSLPPSGHTEVVAYLYAQLDHNRAVVIHISAWYEEAVREHIARFSLLEDSPLQGSDQFARLQKR